MKTLKSFAKYLRESRLKDYTVFYLNLLQEIDIPLVKLAIEKGLIKDLKDEASVITTMERQAKSLLSIEDDSVITNAKINLKLWEEDKLPSISKNDILPADLVLVYGVQKKTMFHFLQDYCQDINEILVIVQEIEDLHINLQNEAVQMLFKIQKSTQEQLKETEVTRKRLLEIIEASTDFIGFADIKDRRILYMNQNGRKMVGIGKDEAADKFKVEDVHPDWVNEKLENQWIPISVKNGIWQGEAAFLSRNGDEIPVSMILMSHKKANGEVEFISTVSRDIREQKLAERELKSLNKELERSNTELEQFAYVASHDLQEPLRTISSYVQLLAERYKDKLDKDGNEFIDFVIDGSTRMRLLINSLLEYSRVNKIKPFQWIEPTDIIENIMQDMKEQIIESGTVIKCNELPKIYADPVLIGQLFQNLISNAIKFRDGKNPKIEISGKRENGEVLFSVKDNGIGLKREYDNKIFIIFQRLNSREKYPGTGIGLSICKKIVERHGGKIWVESEPGKGATFYFTIKTTLL